MRLGFWRGSSRRGGSRRRERRRPPATPRPRASRLGRALRVARVVLCVASLGPLAVVIHDFATWVRAGELFRVKQIEVTGARRVRPEELVALRCAAPGTPIFSVDAARLSRDLARHPWIRQASVGKILPDRIAVRLEEREPAAVILSGGDLVEVDAEGVLLPPRPGGAPEDLPLITGVELPQPRLWGVRDTTRAWTAAARMVAVLERRAGRGAQPPFRVDEVHLDAARHEATVMEEDGTLVRFETEEMAARLPELFPVLAELARRDLVAASVDLRFRDQVVVGGVHPVVADSTAVPVGGEQG